MVDKATAARAILKDLGAPEDCDYCLCVGDGKTDEVVFQLLQHEFEGKAQELITATVGKKQTEAAYYVETVKEVESLIGKMASLAV